MYIVRTPSPKGAGFFRSALPPSIGTLHHNIDRWWLSAARRNSGPFVPDFTGYRSHREVPGISPDPFRVRASDAEIDGVVRLAVLLIGSRSIAKEVVLKVITSLESSRPSFDERDLRVATITACRRHRRDRNWRRDVVSTYGQTFVDDDYDGAEFLEILGTLRRVERFAVVLKYYCLESDDQIAKLLGCSVPRARELAARGIRSLRRMMPDD